MVSVAIATYNRATMVREAIEAALAQTRPPEEIVVSDDASTDETPRVLEELARRDGRVRVIRQPVNTGGVPNWNFALAATRGEYVAWCSDDDRFLPDHLEAAVAFLETHPEIGLVHSSFVDSLVAEDQNEVRFARPLRAREPLVVDRGNLSGYLLRYYDWPFHPSTLVFRRAVLERVGDFDSTYALADTDWFVRAAERFRVAMLARRGVINRRHRGNWSNRVGSARMQAEIFSIVDRALDRLWPGVSARKTLWRWLWRSNVRLRLLLTMRARIRNGHAEAARAAWLGALNDTGQPGPWLGLKKMLENAGSAAIVRLAARGAPRYEDASRSVSPL